MNQSESAPGASVPPDSAAGGDEVRLLARIDQTRQELGETVDQLATKADLKAQARAAATRYSAQARSAVVRLGQRTAAWSTAEGPRRFVLPAVVTVAAIAGTWTLLARRHHPPDRAGRARSSVRWQL